MGPAWDDDDDVKVVTNSFLAAGRDGWFTFGDVTDDGRTVDTFIDYAQAFIDYMQQNVGGAAPGDPILETPPTVEAVPCATTTAHKSVHQCRRRAAPARPGSRDAPASLEVSPEPEWLNRQLLHPRVGEASPTHSPVKDKRGSRRLSDLDCRAAEQRRPARLPPCLRQRAATILLNRKIERSPPAAHRDGPRAGQAPNSNSRPL
jgi:hypothetical protein